MYRNSLSARPAPQDQGIFQELSVSTGTKPESAPPSPADIFQQPRRYCAFFGLIATTIACLSGAEIGLARINGVSLPLALAISVLILPAVARLAIVLSQLVMRIALRRLAARIGGTQPQDDGSLPLVVVPIILRGPADVRTAALCASENIAFVPRRPLTLLIDLPDSQTEVGDEDRELAGSLEAELAPLLKQGDVAIHFRKRSFDPKEGIWYGWERKRGKIEEFCRLLDGDRATSFGAEARAPENVRSIVTIDVDSRLLSSTVSELANALDPVAAIVSPIISLQRRKTAGIFERLNTPLFRDDHFYKASFNQAWLGHDLFQGKGLLVVRRFLQGTRGRIPEQTVLSHDHLEAMLVGAVSTIDAVVEEDFPVSRQAWARRQHRWIRGDFQLLPWIWKSTLRPIGKFHLAENLLIHLTPIVCLATVLSSLLILPGRLTLVGCCMGLLLLRPTLLLLPIELSSHMIGAGRWPDRRLRRSAGMLYGEVASWVSAMIFCAADALNSVRAISVTAMRLVFTRRGLLDWNDGAQTGPGFILLAVTGAAAALFAWAAAGRPNNHVLAALVAIWTIGPAAIRASDHQLSRHWTKKVAKTPGPARKPAAHDTRFPTSISDHA